MALVKILMIENGVCEFGQLKSREGEEFGSFYFAIVRWVCEGDDGTSMALEVRGPRERDK